jgi:hypothetical protein
MNDSLHSLDSEGQPDYAKVFKVPQQKKTTSSISLSDKSKEMRVEDEVVDTLSINNNEVKRQPIKIAYPMLSVGVQCKMDIVDITKALEQSLKEKRTQQYGQRVSENYMSRKGSPLMNINRSMSQET